MSRLFNLCGALLLCASAVACSSDDTSDRDKDDDKRDASVKPEEMLDQTETPLPDSIPEETAHVRHQGRAGVIETRVDAESEEEWRKLDLDTGEEPDAAEEKTWDLSFSRSRIRINGGMSGPGAVSVATLTEKFDAISDIPEDAEYRGEDPDSEGEDGDADAEPDNAFYSNGDDWFVYNLRTHELIPREVTYVVKSTEAKHYKLRFIGYYDKTNGTPAIITMRWIALPL